MICKESNWNKQQHERTENERKKQSTAKGLYIHKDELNKFRRCQRRFLPPVRSITCFDYHKLGHTASYYKTKKIQSNQLKMQPMKILIQWNKWRRQSITRYKNHFHGYCYACNDLGHKLVECKLCSKWSTKYYT